MRIQSFRVDPPEGLIGRAREELLARGSEEHDSFRSGYLLGIEDEARAEAPAAAELDALLRERALAALRAETGRSYELSFLKTTNGKAPPADEGVHFDGFHLDTHPAITGETGIELARMLVNLADVPRRLRFARTDRFELARLGHSVHRGDYQVVDLPPEIETSELLIPPVQDGVVYGLRFWASVIPHVGADDESGHFLASYEAVAPYEGEA